MGKRGPAKTPTAIVKLKGYYRPSRHGNEVNNGFACLYLKEAPEPPETLNAKGKFFWNAILKELVKIEGLITSLDLPLLTVLCQNYDLLKETEELSKKHPKEKVYKKIYDRTTKDFLKLANQFGLTPLSRQKIIKDIWT